MVLITEHAQQPSILEEFPQSAPHDILKRWLYIDSHHEDFEQTMEGVAKAVARHDQRFGIHPVWSKNPSDRWPIWDIVYAIRRSAMSCSATVCRRRRRDIAGITIHPNEPWMKQMARNVTMEGCGITTWSAFIRIHLALLAGTDYHEERNHQGKDNVLLFPRKRDLDRERCVQCRERLGGLLSIPSLTTNRIARPSAPTIDRTGPGRVDSDVPEPSASSSFRLSREQRQALKMLAVRGDDFVQREINTVCVLAIGAPLLLWW
jgi:hypothetical protein